MQSWLLFRKRRSQSSRRPPCGKDCGATAGEALCIGKADPYCVVEIVNDEGLSYRLGRTPVIPHDHYPKWRKEFSTILDIESNARLLIKVLDSDMNESTNVDVLGQASFPLRDIIMSPPKAIRLSLSIKHPGMRIPRSVGAPRRHTIHGASSSVQRGSRRTLRATIGGGSTLGPGSGGPGSGGPGSQQVGSEGPGSQQVGSLTAGSLRTGLGAGGLGGGSSEFEDSEAAPRPAGYCSSFNSSFRNSDSGGAGGKSGSCMSRVKVEFRWYDMSKDLHTTDLNVPQTYFRRSHGNLVRLYHDAECLEGQFEDIETELGPFHAHSTWNDISEALENAQHFIFVAGWSVNPSISLTRSHKPVERSPLGRKAASAVERNGGGERSGGVERSGERSRGNSRQKSGEKSDKARMDKAGMTKPGMDKPGMDKPGMDKPGMDRLGMDRPGADVDNSAVENAAASCYTTDRSASVSASSPALPGHSPILSREKGAENEQPNGNDMPRSAGDMPRSANGKSEQVNGGEKGDRLLSPEVRSGRSRETIGELLKRRAEEGLSVCVVVWDDITSREGVSWLKDGLMATYDEYTREYFRDTKVEVAVVKRIAGDDLGEVSDLLKWTSFTHHQKIVVYDSENPLDRGSPRRVVGAFVGGLDLTSGRYDTAAHSPFSSLKTAHRNDFYNGCLVEATAETGPREPWHDIHARILGPAAWDVLQTYIERVSKQAPRMVHATSLKVAELRDNHLLKDGKKVLIHPDHPAAWDVQVFRSLDSEAALFENSMWTAKFGNNTHFVDRGIQQAYSYLIKKAQHYIYIENQYFLGSCQYWRQHDDVPCRNLVPWMLADRICESIACDREFCVYVLIPLFPEGAPSSVSVQEILHWQFQTMRMMYKKVATTLEEYGKTDCHPTDYLSFFFAGVREPDAKLSTTRTSLPTDVATALATKRHPIYIHSKLMMIDDEYILLGSANINERSLNGSRDTEIAVGCIQPHFRAVEDENGHVQYPNGAVRAFRLQLWHEHLDVLEPEYRECPHSSKCMRLVRGRALQNWLAYINPQMCALPYGHLCPYPLMVAQDGEVESLREHPNIPGWNASVCGSRSALLPSSLTT